MKKNNLKIRRYRPEDNRVIRELNLAGIEQMFADNETLKRLRLMPNIDEDLDDIEGVYLQHGEFIVGLENGEIVAMGAFKKRTPTGAEFKRLRIRPDRQRQGYGETIMGRLEKMAAEKGYNEGFLVTLKTNTRAQKLFEKLGWERSGAGKDWEFEQYFYSKKLG